MCIKETQGNLAYQCCDLHAQQQSKGLGRRGFLGALGAAGLVATAAKSATAFDEKASDDKRPERPAEALIKELYSSLDDSQKSSVVLPSNHGAENGKAASRHGMYNAPFGGKKIGDNYTTAQQDLIEKILRAMTRDDDGYIKLTRAGRFDNSKNLQGCGATMFGTPGDDNKFSFVFTSHHLTVRCDGNSSPDEAFGGPLYYGHSAVGYATGNVYYYQTKKANKVFEALDGGQQKQALCSGNPGEEIESIQFRDEKSIPGIGVDALSNDQQELVADLMRSVLQPFREEDAQEVMDIIEHNGGMDKLNLAYYQDNDTKDKVRWHFWRIEGPGMVWNFRPLPHVHCFVNIAKV